MRLPGWKSLLQATRWLRSRAGERALVLGYHRITHSPFDPYSLCVSPERFAEQLEVIRCLARPVRLDELRHALTSGHPIDRLVAVTFDDGYTDFVSEALVLLERHEVPATVFLVAEALGQEFWWEALARILDPRRGLPARLRLAIDGVLFAWNAGGDLDDAGTRRELVLALHRRLLPLSTERRKAALQALSTWAGPDPTEPAVTRSLSADEVGRLARVALVDVGSHSCTHPALAILPEDGQRVEIERSKVTLEALVGRPVHAFSYPHGSTSVGTARLVRESGYRCACTSRNDVIRPTSDLFGLPRFWIPDWDGPTFSRWLHRWLDGHRSPRAW